MAGRGCLEGGTASVVLAAGRGCLEPLRVGQRRWDGAGLLQSGCHAAAVFATVTEAVCGGCAVVVERYELQVRNRLTPSLGQPFLLILSPT